MSPGNRGSDRDMRKPPPNAAVPPAFAGALSCWPAALLCAVFFFFSFSSAPQALTAQSERNAAACLALHDAYPELGCELRDYGNSIWLECQNGGKLLFADNIARAEEELLDSPAIVDQFASVYPLEMDYSAALDGKDPGRTRNYPLLAALYGKNRAEVEANLEYVDFLGQKVRFNKKHGASLALARVAGRLAPQLEEKPELRTWLSPLGGGYLWRTISGERRLSAHSYGIAIDLNPKKGIYWRWKPGKAQLERVRKEFPVEIVQAFEDEGFVWGGKWARFDFMHFEYRPEILLYSGAISAASCDGVLRQGAGDNTLQGR